MRSFSEQREQCFAASRIPALAMVRSKAALYVPLMPLSHPGLARGCHDLPREPGKRHRLRISLRISTRPRSRALPALVGLCPLWAQPAKGIAHSLAQAPVAHPGTGARIVSEETQVLSSLTGRLGRMIHNRQLTAQRQPLLRVAVLPLQESGEHSRTVNMRSHDPASQRHVAKYSSARTQPKLQQAQPAIT